MGQFDSPPNVILFALAMIDATKEWRRNIGGSQVSCRAGVHHGACIGGVVGNKMQRYHIFGELMTALEILESTAPDGVVQVSRACKEAVEKHLPSGHGFIFEARSDDKLRTSKGDEHEYDDVGGNTYLTTLAPLNWR